MHIWQTKKWWEMLLASNQAENLFYVDNIQIEKRSIWMKQYWFFILACYLEQIAKKETFKKIKDLAEKENVLFVQIETLEYSKKTENIYTELFKDNKWYYKKFITPYTAVIDLEKSEEDILSEMKPKWRYNIKLARKKWVEIKSVEKNKKNIKKYYELMLETTSRDNFSGNNLEYYITFLEKLENSELLLAYKDDIVIAWGIFIFDENISIYYYWASTSKKEYRNLMAPYLLQWEAILISKERGSKIFDFLWVSSPNSKNDPLSWVTNFKKKLTSDIRFVSESYIFINKKLKYNLFKIIRKIKSLIK